MSELKVVVFNIKKVKERLSTHHIIYSYHSCLKKARRLLNVCVGHSTQRRERWYQVVKFSPHKDIRAQATTGHKPPEPVSSSLMLLNYCCLHAVGLGMILHPCVTE